VGRVLKEAGLEGIEGRLIKNISRGQKQRVGIAQALIHDPHVLILDEPTIGLDPAQIIEIRELIRGLRGEHTIMISTHILAEVQQVCDGAVIINEGRLMASGSLDDLTASMKQRAGVVLKVRRGAEDAAALFRRVPGVERAAVQGSEIVVEWRPGDDHRDEIVGLAAEHRLGLLEMRPSAVNIEDLYMKVISGGLK
jgi:ABC-2 type transport system ATP-binding protein